MPIRHHRSSRNRNHARPPPVETNDLKVIRTNKFYVVNPIKKSGLGNDNNISNRINIDELNEFFESLKAVDNYDLTEQIKKKNKMDIIMFAIIIFTVVVAIVIATAAKDYVWISGILFLLGFGLCCFFSVKQQKVSLKMFSGRKKLIDEKINAFNQSTLSQKQLTLEMDHQHAWYIIKYTGPLVNMQIPLIEGQSEAFQQLGITTQPYDDMSPIKNYNVPVQFNRPPSPNLEYVKPKFQLNNTYKEDQRHQNMYNQESHDIQNQPYKTPKPKNQ